MAQEDDLLAALRIAGAPPVEDDDLPRSPSSTVCAMTCRRVGGSPARLDGSKQGCSGSEHSISLAVGARLLVEYPAYPVTPAPSL